MLRRKEGGNDNRGVEGRDYYYTKGNLSFEKKMRYRGKCIVFFPPKKKVLIYLTEKKKKETKRREKERGKKEEGRDKIRRREV